MKMKLLIGLLFSSGFIMNAQTAQKIGLNPTMLDNSAILEVESTAKGFLPPRMTTVQRDAITTPTAVGLVIYNTTTKKLEIWDGTNWSGGGGGAGDNLGDHTATDNLEMASKDITNVNKISTTSAQISKGTDGGTPTAGQVATAADANGNIVWKSLPSIPKLEAFTGNGNNNTATFFNMSPSGGIIIMKGSLVSLIIPNNPAIGTNYTIINQAIGASQINSSSSSGGYWVDGISYDNGDPVNPTFSYRIPNGTTLKIYHEGNNRWFTY